MTMFYAQDHAGMKTRPTPRERGRCPHCGAEVIAKCGSVYAWHWAHKTSNDCDSWYEPETEWHIRWKEHAPAAHCEVTVGNHRADVLGSRGVVVELQNSPISADTIIEREKFYPKMIWIVNAQEFADRLTFYQDWQRGTGKLREFHFDWDHPRISWCSSSKPVFLDIGERDFEIIRWQCWTELNGMTWFRGMAPGIVNGRDYLIWARSINRDGRNPVSLVKRETVIGKYFT